MTPINQWSTLSITCVTVLLCAAAASADIIVPDWRLVTGARDAVGPFVNVVRETVAFPFGGTDTATDQLTWAQSTYDFSRSGNVASFDFDFQFHRSELDSWALSGGHINFMTDQPLSFEVTGTLGLIGPGRVKLDVVLEDLSGYGGSIVYRSWHESRATPNDSFGLGSTGGDYVSEEIGQPFGTLLPGVPYELQYVYEIENYQGESTEPGSAVGALTFTMTPEPGSFLLMTIVGALLLRRGR